MLYVNFGNLSIDKYVFMQISSIEEPISNMLKRKTLNASANTTDSGVIIHSLKPALHCVRIASKAHVCTKLILKCFLLHEMNLLKRAFNTYVRQ